MTKKRIHAGYLSQIRDCVPPSRNGLAHANASRDPEMAEELFWTVLAEIKQKYPEKTIWLYTGYTLGECEPFDENGVVNPDEFAPKLQCILRKRWEIIKSIDVLIDGIYKEKLRDISLHWIGSSNQRVIDIKKSLEKGEVVLWDTN